MDEQTKLKRRLERMLKRPENMKCADCNRKGARWASVNLGSFFCIECSGIHRNLGVHVSFVRSIGLDTWTQDQVEFMESWGNSRANAYYEGNLPSPDLKPHETDSVATVTKFIKDKYVRKLYLAACLPPAAASRQTKSTTKAKTTTTSLHKKKEQTPQAAVSHQEVAPPQPPPPPPPPRPPKPSQQPQQQQHHENRKAKSSHVEQTIQLDPLLKTMHVDLKSLSSDLAQSSVAFHSCTFHSDQYIAIRNTDERDSSSHLIVVSPTSRQVVFCQPTLAESIIMHPLRCIAALRNGSRLQIFNLESHENVKSCVMAEEVVFWRWVSPSAIGIVTPSAVFHWAFREGEGAGTPDDQREPVRVFERESNLPDNHSSTNNTQTTPMTVMPPHVVNYHVSESGKWCLLVSITFCHSGEFLGEMQLFSLEKQVGQLLSGRNGVFTSLMLAGREQPSEVLCFEHKDDEGVCMIRIMEVGFDASRAGCDENATAFKTEPVPLLDLSREDFPAALAVCPLHHILYVFTSMGLVFLIGIESGVMLHHQPLEAGTVFSCCASSSQSGGVLYVMRNDTEVTHLTVDFEELSLSLRSQGLSHVLGTLRGRPVASALAATGGVTTGGATTEETLLESDVFLLDESAGALSSDSSFSTPACSNSSSSGGGDQKASSGGGGGGGADEFWNSHAIADVFESPPPPPPPPAAPVDKPAVVHVPAACFPPEKKKPASSKKSYETETLWDTKQVQNLFSMPPQLSSSSSSSSSFDFSLPEPTPQHHHPRIPVHHPPDQYHMSTLDMDKAFSSSVSTTHIATSTSTATSTAVSTKSCSECTHLLKQLAGSLDNLDRVQAENAILKENLNTLSNRTKLLFTTQDCDVYEEELLQCFQRVKERKAELSLEKDRQEHEQKYCVICQERIRNVILLPCGHICLCQACVQNNNVQFCPLDRKKIDSYQVVYF